jgi:hypothetical protein
MSGIIKLIIAQQLNGATFGFSFGHNKVLMINNQKRSAIKINSFSHSNINSKQQ